jgi:hypothetical protein
MHLNAPRVMPEHTHSEKVYFNEFPFLPREESVEVRRRIREVLTPEKKWFVPAAYLAEDGSLTAFAWHLSRRGAVKFMVDGLWDLLLPNVSFSGPEFPSLEERAKVGFTYGPCYTVSSDAQGRDRLARTTFRDSEWATALNDARRRNRTYQRTPNEPG